MLSRRQFAGRALAGVAALFAGSLATIGYAKVKGDGRRSRITACDDSTPWMQVRRCFWNGYDITCSCFECDRDAGWAKVFLAKKSDGICGMTLLDGAKGELHGKITIEWRDTDRESKPVQQAIVGLGGVISIIPPRS